jgi:translation initiation factor 2 alpha subunit (eIF-2alpha)
MAARTEVVRYYEKAMPDEEEVVMCRVVRLDRGGGDAKAGLGAYVELLEYGNMTGLVRAAREGRGGG